MNISLGYRPRKWQQECHNRVKRFVVLALHRRAGKTEWAIMELIDNAVSTSLELANYIYMAPWLKQARAIVWGRLKARLDPLLRARAVEIHEANMEVRFKHNGAVITLAGADNPDALRGMRIDGIVVDEVAQIVPEVWTEVLQPCLADRLGWAYFIGTPKGINLFSQLYYGAASKEDWHAARYTVYDTDALDKREVERLRDPTVTPENAFAREFLCDFTAGAEDQVISLSDAEQAAQRRYQPADYEGAAKILGVDPARFGDDRAVIMKRQGLRSWPAIVYRGLDNMTLASHVASVMNEWKPDAVFIDSGAGAGIIDRLRQLGYACIEVPFGGRALAPQAYINRRTEMWFAMRDWLVRDGGAIDNDMVLKQELATPIYWFDAQERRVLEPKDEIKKRLQGAASPDTADALALTFAHPVQKEHDVEDRLLRAARRDQKPYSMFDIIRKRP